MGKTILILGNGFDLAHGLPTSYAGFQFEIKLRELSKNRIILTSRIYIFS